MCHIRSENFKGVYRFHELRKFYYKRKTWKSSQSEKLPTEKQVNTVTRVPTMWLVLRVSRWPSELGFHSLGSTVSNFELVSAFLPSVQWVPQLPCLFLMASTASQVLGLCVLGSDIQETKAKML